MNRGFELQGHRGARGLFAENTIEGFIAASSFDLDSFELDIAVTADGVAVVVHDPRLHPDLTRGPDGAWLSGPGPSIRSLSWAEVKTYDVGRVRPGSAAALAHPLQQAFDGARVPQLAAVFATTTIRIDAELKTEPAHPDLTVSPAEMADAVMAVATQAGALDRLAVRSFDWRGLEHMRRHYPAIPLAWLTDRDAAHDIVQHVAAASRDCPYQPTWAPFHGFLTRESLSQAHALGLRVVPWTVNAPADIARLIAWGVDGICTDRPDLARDVMKATP
jgi:glycerophosphoryl diester phosphodiesterase